MAPPRNKNEFVKVDVQALLIKELECLKRKADFGWELKVSWLPSSKGELDGEVKQNIIYVYSLEFNNALQTLRHEFFDYCICQAIEPYKEMANIFINLLIKRVNDDAYRIKEKSVRALLSLIGDRNGSYNNTLE